MDDFKKSIEFKKELDALRPLSQEDEKRIMDKFRLDWNYHSNHLEGNTLTFGETKALILYGITADGKPIKDHFEITGHNDAINWVLDIVKEDRPLTESFIRELHKLILKEPYETEAITLDGKRSKKLVRVGEYKTSDNHVKTSTGEIFRFASAEETPAKMHDLLVWYNDEIAKEDVNPILLAAEFHYKYIRIHPFDDGNGRTARILMNFIFMKFGYPPVIIKTEDKENYFVALQQADVGLLTPFVEYINSNLIESLKIMISGAKGEEIEELDDVEKEIALLKQRFSGEKKYFESAKSEEAFHFCYDQVISKFINEIVFQSRKMNEFYFKSEFDSVLYIAHKNYHSQENITGNEDEMKSSFLEHANVDISQLNFRLNYKVLQKLKHIDIVYSEMLIVIFDQFKYSLIFRNLINGEVENSSTILECSYSDTIVFDKVKSLVKKYYTKANIDFIKQKLDSETSSE